MSAVASPITRIVTRKVYFRPTTSPMRPEKSAPGGRRGTARGAAGGAPPPHVADAPEEERAEGAHGEPRAEGGEAREEPRGRVALGEEEAAEEHRERAVEVEVVPLEQRAERRGE